MKIIEKTFDIITNEEKIIERDETKEEILAREIEETKKSQIAIQQAEAEAARATAQAKLAVLGLTTDDLKALGL